MFDRLSCKVIFSIGFPKIQFRVRFSGENLRSNLKKRVSADLRGGFNPFSSIHFWPRSVTSRFRNVNISTHARRRPVNISDTAGRALSQVCPWPVSRSWVIGDPKYRRGPLPHENRDFWQPRTPGAIGDYVALTVRREWFMLWSQSVIRLWTKSMCIQGWFTRRAKNSQFSVRSAANSSLP